MALTGKRLKFAQEYAVDQNATQAAIRAGYSKKTAYAQGSRLLKDVEVRAAVGLAALSAAEEAGVRAAEVLDELRRIALVDIGQAFDAEGNLKPLKDIPPDVRRAIAGVETEESWLDADDGRISTGRVRKVKFWDKNKALELLGKHFKLYTDVHEHELGKMTLEQLIAEASKPAKKGGEP